MRIGWLTSEYRLGLVGLTVLAAALRFPTLGLQSLYLDEAYTLVIALQLNLGDAISLVSATESTPPLYYVLVWGWAQVFGTEEAGLRSLSALLGTATVPVTYRAGAALVGSRTGLIAAALVAVSPLLVWYSQEARAYALLVFLAALSLLLLARVLDEPSRGRLALWALSGALLIATHYFAVFLVVAEGGWLFLRLRERRVAVALALTAIAAAGAGLLPLALDQRAADRTAWIGDIPLGSRVETTLKEFLTGPTGAPGAGLGVIAFALVLFGLWRLLRRTEPISRRRALLVGAAATFSIALPFLLSFTRFDYFYPRNLIGAWPLLAVAIAAGFAVRASRAAIAAAAALCLTLAAVTLSVPFRAEVHRPDWRAVGKAIGEAPAPRALVVTPVWEYVPLRAYRRDAEILQEPRALVRDLVLVASREALAVIPPDTGPPGFREVAREPVQGLGLIRYRSEVPRQVSPMAVQRWIQARGLIYPAVLTQGRGR